jgi:hypothetical protein
MSRKPVTDLEKFAGPGVAAERRARKRLRQAAERRRAAREARRAENRNNNRADEDQKEVNYKVRYAHIEHDLARSQNALDRHIAQMARNARQPTVDFEEEDMFGNPDSTDTEGQGLRGQPTSNPGLHEAEERLRQATAEKHTLEQQLRNHIHSSKESQELRRQIRHIDERINTINHSIGFLDTHQWIRNNRRGGALSGMISSKQKKALSNHIKGKGTRSHTNTSTKADTRGNKTSTSTITSGGPHSSGQTTINIGRGWEDEMAAAIARDAEREKDKEVANNIRDAAAADSKRRIDNTSRKIH